MNVNNGPTKPGDRARNEESIRKEVIADIETLYPPDTHVDGWELLRQALCHQWRELPLPVLNSLKCLCAQQEAR